MDYKLEGGQKIFAKIKRDTLESPWGIRIHGGADLFEPITVVKVTPGSPADGFLTTGDVIVGIGDWSAESLSHEQAIDLISNAGVALVLSALRGANIIRFRKPTSAALKKFLREGVEDDCDAPDDFAENEEEEEEDKKPDTNARLAQLMKQSLQLRDESLAASANANANPTLISDDAGKAKRILSEFRNQQIKAIAGGADPALSSRSAVNDKATKRIKDAAERDKSLEVLRTYSFPAAIDYRQQLKDQVWSNAVHGGDPFHYALPFDCERRPYSACLGSAASSRNGSSESGSIAASNGFATTRSEFLEDWMSPFHKRDTALANLFRFSYPSPS